MSRVDFVHVLKSPHTGTRLQMPMRIELHPHALGGYLVQVCMVEGYGMPVHEGFATASDLRELAGKFYAAAAVLTGEAPP